LCQAHGVLSVLCGESLFVTERGRLSGVVTWPEVTSASRHAPTHAHTHIDITTPT
jgi:hypothetical protein